MILCVDVQYAEASVVAACVGFEEWADATTVDEWVSRDEQPPEPYEPGQFYRRELPHLLRVLQPGLTRAPVNAILVDGHVWLAAGRPGLGAHLYEALERKYPVMGVAKSAFHESVAVPVVRGASQRPLYVTAVGMENAEAAERVRTLHGAHRVPTLIKRADQLARGLVLPRTSG